MRFRAARVEAYDIWTLAVEQRQELMGALRPTVIVQPIAAPPPKNRVRVSTRGFSVGVSTP